MVLWIVPPEMAAKLMVDLFREERPLPLWGRPSPNRPSIPPALGEHSFAKGVSVPPREEPVPV